MLSQVLAGLPLDKHGRADLAFLKREHVHPLNHDEITQLYDAVAASCEEVEMQISAPPGERFAGDLHALRTWQHRANKKLRAFRRVRQMLQEERSRAMREERREGAHIPRQDRFISALKDLLRAEYGEERTAELFRQAQANVS